MGPCNVYKFCLLSQSDLHLVVDSNEGVLRLLPGANGVTGCAYWIGVSGRGGGEGEHGVVWEVGVSITQ